MGFWMLRAVIMTLFRYWYNLLYGLDVLVNILFGGDRRETISGRLGKGHLAKKPVHTVLSYFVDALFFVLTGDKYHCFNSIHHLDDHYAVSSTWDRYVSRYRRG